MNYNWLVFANKSRCDHAKALKDKELGYYLGDRTE